MDQLTEGRTLQIEKAVKGQLDSEVLTILVPEKSLAVLEASLQHGLQDVVQLKITTSGYFHPCSKHGGKARTCQHKQDQNV